MRLDHVKTKINLNRDLRPVIFTDRRGVFPGGRYSVLYQTPGGSGGGGLAYHDLSGDGKVNLIYPAFLANKWLTDKSKQS